MKVQGQAGRSGLGCRRSELEYCRRRPGSAAGETGDAELAALYGGHVFCWFVAGGGGAALAMEAMRAPPARAAALVVAAVAAAALAHAQAPTPNLDGLPTGAWPGCHLRKIRRRLRIPRRLHRLGMERLQDRLVRRRLQGRKLRLCRRRSRARDSLDVAEFHIRRSFIRRCAYRKPERCGCR